ncbi:MAG: tetratricopeptide repeat protein [Flagellimonas sp.]
MKKIFLFTVGLLFAQMVQGQKISGYVYLISSGEQPVRGIEVRSDSSNIYLSLSNGYYELGFPTKKIGDAVPILVGRDNRIIDYKGNEFELINGRELQKTLIPSNPENSPLKIIVSPKGQRDLVAMEYFGILKTNATSRIAALEKELKASIAKLGRANILVAEKEMELERYRFFNDSIKLYREAYRISGINKDGQNKRVISYLDALKAGVSIEEARGELNATAAYDEGQKGVNTIKASIDELRTLINTAMATSNFIEAFEYVELLISLTEHELLDSDILIDALTTAQMITMYIPDHEKHRSGKNYNEVGEEMGDKLLGILKEKEHMIDDYSPIINMFKAIYESKKGELSSSEELLKSSLKTLDNNLNKPLDADKKEEIRHTMVMIEFILGIVHIDQGKQPMAPRFISPAIAHMDRKLSDTTRPDLIRTKVQFHQALAQAYEGMYEFDKAESEYFKINASLGKYIDDKTIRIREEQDVPGTTNGYGLGTSLRYQLAMNHKALAEFYDRTLQSDKAESSYLESISVYGGVVDKRTGSFLFSYIDLIDDLIEFYLEHNTISKVEGLYRKKIELLESLRGRVETVDTGDINYQYMELATFFSNIGDLEKADLLFNKTLDNTSPIGKKEDPSPFTRLKTLEHAIKNLYRKKDLKRANDLVLQFIRECARSFEDDSNKFTYRVQNWVIGDVYHYLITNGQIHYIEQWSDLVFAHFKGREFEDDHRIFLEQFHELRLKIFRDAEDMEHFKKAERDYLEFLNAYRERESIQITTKEGYDYLAAENESLGLFKDAESYLDQSLLELQRLKNDADQQKYHLALASVLEKKVQNLFHQLALHNDQALKERIKSTMAQLEISISHIQGEDRQLKALTASKDNFTEMLSGWDSIYHEELPVTHKIDRYNREIASAKNFPLKQVYLSDRVIALYEGLKRSPGKNIDSLLAQAHGNKSWYELNSGRFDSAHTSALKGISLDPGQRWIYTNLALALNLLDRPQEATEIYLGLKDDHFGNNKKFSSVFLEDLAHLNKESIYHENLERAKTLLTDSLHTEEKLALIRRYLKFAKGVQETDPLAALEHYLAVKELVSGLRSNKESFEKLEIGLNAKIGSCYFSLENYPESLAYFYKVPSRDHTYTNLNMIGLCHYHLKEYTQATDSYQRAKSIAQEGTYEFAYLNNMAMAELKGGNHKKALKILKEFEQKFPEDPLTFRNWSAYYASRKKNGTALDYLEKAVSKGYSNLDWLKNDDSLNNLRESARFIHLVAFVEDNDPPSP